MAGELHRESNVTRLGQGVDKDGRLSQEAMDRVFKVLEDYAAQAEDQNADQRVAVLTAISKNEKDPKQPAEKFFREIKARTAHAYYTSKIGIHQEMEYKGNVPIKEFVGFDVSSST